MNSNAKSDTQSFEQRLDRLGEIAVKVGVRVKPGQELVMTAPIEALPLGARLAVARNEGTFAVTAAGGYLPARHLVPIDASEYRCPG